AYNVYGINTSCGADNGSFHIEQKDLPNPAGIRWVNAANTTVGTAMDVYGLANGTYRLYMRNNEGCEVLYRTATLQSIQPLAVSFDNVLAINDVCNQTKGGVKGIVISRGVAPFTYMWKSGANETVGSSLDLLNIAYGNYSITVTDALGCTLASGNYEVVNQTELLSIPTLKDIKLCGPGNAILTVQNPIAGSTYNLYDTENSDAILATSLSGNFTVQIQQSRDYYVSRVLGNCESLRKNVNITTGLSKLTIPNAFSPNNDNVNDVWEIQSIENYPNAIVQIFNRTGIKVFESVGYKTSFNGKLAGKELPSGVYYYIIHLGSQCSLITGSLTIIL
ncbi:MAG: gliding motility-associated C-terminal domain-containing protein, partial [Chitinophagaceae bacterium]